MSVPLKSATPCCATDPNADAIFESSPNQTEVDPRTKAAIEYREAINHHFAPAP